MLPLQYFSTVYYRPNINNCSAVYLSAPSLRNRASIQDIILFRGKIVHPYYEPKVLTFNKFNTVTDPLLASSNVVKCTAKFRTPSETNKKNVRRASGTFAQILHEQRTTMVFYRSFRKQRYMMDWSTVPIELLIVCLMKLDRLPDLFSASLVNRQWNLTTTHQCLWRVRNLLNPYFYINTPQVFHNTSFGSCRSFEHSNLGDWKNLVKEMTISERNVRAGRYVARK